MKSISIRELHEKTGQWIRQAGADEQIIITDRGEPIALISAYRPLKKNPFKQRRLLARYARLRGKLSGGTDSNQIVSDDRERA